MFLGEFLGMAHYSHKFSLCESDFRSAGCCFYSLFCRIKVHKIVSDEVYLACMLEISSLRRKRVRNK